MIDYGNASRRALAAGATRPWWGSLAVLECRERAPLAELVGRRRAAQLGETEGDPYPLLHLRAGRSGTGLRASARIVVRVS